MRMLLVVFAAVIVAGGTGLYIVQGLRAPAAEAVAEVQAPVRTDVFVPASELAAGTLIQPIHLGRMAIPIESVTAEMVVADADGEKALVGSVARQALPAGVPIARSMIVQPGDRGFLAAVLPKGMLAITIPISEVAGLHGLALPGDRVDIILTYMVAAEGDNARDIHASETILGNLRVLAMDQRLGPAPAKVEEDGDAGASPVARTATLEVTSRQAEMITLATQLGTLSLALNSVRDGEGGMPADKVAKVRNELAPARFALHQPTLDSDVTSVLPNQAGEIQIVRGAVAGLRQTSAEAGGTEAAAAAPVETQ